jgi:gas vesicle protein
MTKQSKIFAGLLAGAALGAVVALVVSSDSNSDLKNKVSDWLCDLTKASKDKLSDVATLVKESIDKVKA